MEMIVGLIAGMWIGNVLGKRFNVEEKGAAFYRKLFPEKQYPLCRCSECRKGNYGKL